MKILFDWDGTIAKHDIATQASIRRFKTISKFVDSDLTKNASKDGDNYKLSKQLISKYTGTTDDKESTELVTDLFRIHYLAVIHELGDKALYDGMLEVIRKLYTKGHKLAIASTLRSDLIKDSLKKLKMDAFFEKVYANTPDLKYSKKDVVEMARKNLGSVDYMIGDKEEDIRAGIAVKAKTIYVTWGITTASFIGISEHNVSKPEEIWKIIDK
jgi:phosphoglycolate phosphatase-like HAD superfamily hydrolase